MPRCVNVLEEFPSGEALIGREVISRNAKNVFDMRRKVGMVFQSYELVPHKTILENILFAPLKVQKCKWNEVEREALALLEKVGLVDRINDYSRQLSGGRKRRVAIVRALIMHQEILALDDEMTVALDLEMAHEVLKVVVNPVKSESSMMIVPREMAFAKTVVTRVLFLENGEIIEESNQPGEFFDTPKTERVRPFLNSFEY